MSSVNILLFLSDYKVPKSARNEQTKSRGLRRFFGNKVSKSAGNERGPELKTYVLDGSNRSFEGIQTNDAPVRYFFDQAKKSGKTVKRVLCITSHMVLTKPEDKPQFERFREYVYALSDEYGMARPEEYIDIPYDYDEEKNKKDLGMDLPASIYYKLSSCFQSIEPDEEVFIDYTGGLRDISFLMTSIIRFLEFRGLTCGEIVYSHLFNSKIYNIHYIYDLFHLINGVNEFINTGNARELVKSYKIDKSDNPAGYLIQSLIEFSDALSICNIGALDNIVERLQDSLELVEKSDDSDMASSMLKSLVPIIREKMYLDKGLDYPKMIQWCTENNMIQQAATIYTDKMPRYYFENNLVPEFVQFDDITVSLGHDQFSTAFYSELFDRCAEGIEVDIFKNSLKKIQFDFNDLGDWSAVIQCLAGEKASQTGIIREAYNELTKFINSCFDYDTLRMTDNTYSVYRKYKYVQGTTNRDGDPYVLEAAKLPNTFKEFWYQLISENSYWRHRFLYNDETAYLVISTAPKHNTDKTLRKKAQAIKNVKENKISKSVIPNPDALAERMAYYLAVKIIRNRINHAAEGSMTNDEQKTMEYLSNTFEQIDFDNGLYSYRRILLDGIEK